MKNCVFLDKAGFDINMQRSRGWSRRGAQAIIKSLSARGVSHTVTGDISALGVANVSMREPGNIKKRIVVGATKRKAPGDMASAILKGTMACHYVQFNSDTLDIMDVFPSMKGLHIAMANAPIHSPEAIDPIILERVTYVYTYIATTLFYLNSDLLGCFGKL
jgi:hypothetical protein